MREKHISYDGLSPDDLVWRDIAIKFPGNHFHGKIVKGRRCLYDDGDEPFHCWEVQDAKGACWILPFDRGSVVGYRGKMGWHRKAKGQ
jgi:hypothetical protein